MVLLSFKAGLRACEIAGLDWSMVMRANGRIGDAFHVSANIAKMGSARHVPIHPDLRAAIAQLNDAFRQGGGAGRLAITSGVIALGARALIDVMEAARGFETFEVGNDPHGEHDFGSLTWRGHRLFWKIDCYDRQLQFGSPDNGAAHDRLQYRSLMPIVGRSGRIARHP